MRGSLAPAALVARCRYFRKRLAVPPALEHWVMLFGVVKGLSGDVITSLDFPDDRVEEFLVEKTPFLRIMGRCIGVAVYNAMTTVCFDCFR